MKFSIVRLFIFILSFSFLVACGAGSQGLLPKENTPLSSGSQLEEPDEGIGTTIWKPVTNELIPSFIKKQYLKYFLPLGVFDVTNWQENFDGKRIEDGIFFRSLLFHGSVSMAFDRLGTEVSESFLKSGITEVSETEQKFSLVNSVRFMKVDLNLDVEIKLEPGTSDTLRLYFINRNNSQRIGTYLITLDAQGNAVRGLVAFVNADTFNNPVSQLPRALFFVYDLSVPDKPHFITSSDQYGVKDGFYYANKLEQLCDEADKKCRAEYIEVDSAAPVRKINPKTIAHFSYASNEDACMVLPTYNADSTVTSRKSYKIDAQGLTETPCDYLPPDWALNYPSPDDMLMRYDDTNPVGGDAKAWFMDGASQDGWNSLNLKTIDEWIK